MSDLDVSQLISVAEAKAILNSIPVKPRQMHMPLFDAVGSILAEPLLADRDFPAVDKSQMDGYAVRSHDLANGPCDLLIVERVIAGQRPTRPLNPGEAMSIMTGASLPFGANAVVPMEHVEVSSNRQRARFKQPVAAGSYVAQQGSEAAVRSVALAVGTRINAPQIAVAASVGATRLWAFNRPTIGVLATGDELVAITQAPGPTQIRSCNNAMLLTYLANFASQLTDLTTVVDDRTVIRRAIERGLNHDVLFVTGGMSVGERDYVPGALRELGGDLKISKLRIRPGKPFVFAQMPSGAFVFGLPGNPVSALVCTIVLASGFLRRLAGDESQRPPLRAPLAGPLNANGPREFYQPAKFAGSAVQPLPWRSSADVFTLAEADVLIRREEAHPPKNIGDLVDVFELS